MTTDLERAHTLSERLVAARADHRRAEHALAVLLAELVADQLFRPLGYTSVEEFAADRLDLTARQTRDLVRIGRALPRLPLLDAALTAGELDWTKAREIVRVATDATEAAWIQRAQEVPSRASPVRPGSRRRLALREVRAPRRQPLPLTWGRRPPGGRGASQGQGGAPARPRFLRRQPP